jgi:hypothetical protein
MKIFDVFGKSLEAGEQLLGSRDTGSHACYLIYGKLGPGERGRELKPGHGHEELILALQGDLQMSGHSSGTLKQGQAIHLRGEEALCVGNAGAAEAVYVVAGGHSDEGHH